MRSVGLEIKNLSNEFFRYSNRYLMSRFPEQHSPMQTFFIHYIGKQKEAVYQKDLEFYFNIRRSTASGILQQMEKLQLITRKSNDIDGRLKDIKLTSSGQAYFLKTLQAFKEMNQQLANDISAEEIVTFLAVVDKIKNNIKEEEHM
ncbi:MarR family winged helix-turn-helix transcriptional regulator [Vagococcus sp.]|uniref:MarR family winged helix-turn-helix transcriptional regulator n=1 Tax=Vagococcus sp. TaxID=1933889 RepID=UPI003F975FCA